MSTYAILFCIWMFGAALFTPLFANVIKARHELSQGEKTCFALVSVFFWPLTWISAMLFGALAEWVKAAR